MEANQSQQINQTPILSTPPSPIPEPVITVQKIKKRNSVVDFLFALFTIVFSLILLIASTLWINAFFILKLGPSEAFFKAYGVASLGWHVICIIYFVVALVKKKGIIRILLPLLNLASFGAFSYHLYIPADTVFGPLTYLALIPMTLLCALIIIARSSKIFAAVLTLIIVASSAYAGYEGYRIATGKMDLSGLLALAGIKNPADMTPEERITEAVKNGYGSEDDIHTTSGMQKIITINGEAHFMLGDNIDYEVWSNPQSTLALGFVENGGQSGMTTLHACAPGTGFFEVTEKSAELTNENLHYKQGVDNRINPHNETFGSNTYEVYNWAFEESIKYYILHYEKGDVEIVYRPNEPCAVGKNFWPDVETFLKTFEYKGMTKAQTSAIGVKNKTSTTTTVPSPAATNPKVIQSSYQVSGHTVIPELSPLIDQFAKDGLVRDIKQDKILTTLENCVTVGIGLAEMSHDPYEMKYGQAYTNACAYYLLH